MAVHPDATEEYAKRHSPIWPELESILKQHGVHNYSIFLHPDTHQLFAYVELESEDKWNAIAHTAVCQEWWKSMKPLMPTNPDNSPKSIPLDEVFHLE